MLLTYPSSRHRRVVRPAPAANDRYLGQRIEPDVDAVGLFASCCAILLIVRGLVHRVEGDTGSYDSRGSWPRRIKKKRLRGGMLSPIRSTKCLLRRRSAIQHVDFSTLECKGGSLVLAFDSWSSRVGEHPNDTRRSSGYG